MLEEKRYCIYKHTNKINGKIYIGQTSQDPKKRWQNGESAYLHNPHFLNAIKKYGWDNFEHEILLEGLTQEEMSYWEDYYIEYYDSRNADKGYNINKGGQISPFQELWKDNDFREKMSKQQSELMKERLKNPKERERLQQISIKNWESHPERKEEYAKRLSEILKELWKDEEYKKARSQDMKELWQGEQREKLIQNSKNNAINNWKNPNYRKKMCKSVINIETGQEFESGAAAARWCGVDRSTITKGLKNNKSAGKHPETGIPLHWRYAMEGGDIS
jgi:group I intron endonuclease